MFTRTLISKNIMNRLFCFLVILLGLGFFAGARSTDGYYGQRASLFEILPASPDDIIFLGNSITDGAEWSELLGNPHAKNRGISGDRVKGVFERLDPITAGKPSKIFLMIGINDVAAGDSVAAIVEGIEAIVERIKAETPRTRIYIESVLPVNDCYNRFKGHTSRWQMVAEINAGLQKLAASEGAAYVDLYSAFVDPATGKMKPEYSNDGLHLLGNGYLKWIEIIKPLVDE